LWANPILKKKIRRVKMKKLITLCAVITVILAISGTAQATLYTIEHSHSQGVGYADVSFNGGSSTVSSYLGRFIMDPVSTLPATYPIYTINNLGSPPHSHDGFFSYCVDPLGSIGVGHGVNYDFTIVSLVGVGDLDAGDVTLVKELLGSYSPLLQNDPTGPYSGGTFRTAAAALQLAIWKINLDRATETLGSWDFSSGLMRINSANVPLESGASLKASGLEGLQNNNANNQDLLIQAIPEPATVALLGLGALSLLRSRKRKV
jgi:hypothetical protein